MSELLRRHPIIVYALLSLMSMCLMGPTIWFGHHTASALTLLLLLLALAVLVSSYRDAKGSAYIQMALVYACLILIDASMHEIALLHVPGDLLVNVIGQTAAYWVKANAVIALKYLMFPLFLMVQVVLLSRVGFGVAGRIIIGCLVLSMLAQFYQALGDPTFLNPRLAPGKGGLSIDMNAFGLTNFLCFGLFLSLYPLEKERWIRAVGVLLLPAFIAAAYFCGSRAALGGEGLLLFLAPISYAMAKRTWSIPFRIGVSVLPLLLVGSVGLLVLSYGGVGTIASWGWVGNKLASTWHAVAHNGVVGAFDHEMRGWLMSVGLALFKAAPWAGWGPGGFYREASNIVYRHSGMYVAQWDSVDNHYLMILGDLGLPALFLNMMLVLIPVGCAMVVLPRLESFRMRWAVATLFVTNMVFLAYIFVQPPSYFLGPLWVWASLLASMLIIANQHGIGIRWSVFSRTGSQLLLAVLVLSVFGAAWWNSFGADGYAARESYAWWSNAYETNCLPPQLEEGYWVRLCGPNAVTERGYENDIPSVVTFSVRLKSIHRHRAMLTYGQCHAPMKKKWIRTDGWTRVEIPVVRENVSEQSTYQWSEKGYRFKFRLEGQPASGKEGIEVRLPKGDHYRTHYIVGIAMWKTH